MMGLAGFHDENGQAVPVFSLHSARQTKQIHLAELSTFTSVVYVPSASLMKSR